MSCYGDPHAICKHCGLELERRHGLDGIVYLDWRLDPKIDRVKCESSTSKKHAPLDTSADVRQVNSRRP